jgi:hypothetical protein
MDNNQKVKESIIVRGIAAAIQAMTMPVFNNLRDMLNTHGYDLVKKPKQ